MCDTDKREDCRIINPHEGAPSLAVHAEDGRVILAIHRDGTVTGAVEDASEAGARFVAYLRDHVFEQAHSPTDDGREAEETEWEYGSAGYCFDWDDRRCRWITTDLAGILRHEEEAHGGNASYPRRRRAAGPWVPVTH